MARLTRDEVAAGMARLERGFMTPQIYQADVWEIETTAGTEYVEADVVGKGDDATRADLRPYLEGDPRRFAALLLRRGVWVAYLSADGYSDRTDTTIHDSPEEAEAYLVDTYDDEGGA